MVGGGPGGVVWLGVAGEATVLVPDGEGLARKCSNSAPSSVTTPNSSHKACARW